MAFRDMAFRAKAFRSHTKPAPSNITMVAGGHFASWRAEQLRLEKGYLSEHTSEQLSGGAMNAGVFRLGFKEGGEGLMKKLHDLDPLTHAPAHEIMDRELFGSLIAHAIQPGIAPVVTRITPNIMMQSFVPGKVAADLAGTAEGVKELQNAALLGDRGKAIGLLDFIGNNPDRHLGNWMVHQGQATAIDQGGMAFSPYAKLLRQPSAFQGLARNYGTDELKSIRNRLGSLEGEFSAAGRRNWHSYVMSRMDKVIQAGPRPFPADPVRAVTSIKNVKSVKSLSSSSSELKAVGSYTASVQRQQAERLKLWEDELKAWMPKSISSVYGDIRAHFVHEWGLTDYHIGKTNLDDMRHELRIVASNRRTKQMKLWKKKWKKEVKMIGNQNQSLRSSEKLAANARNAARQLSRLSRH